jgi:uncharacterized protein YjbI with pentapeptide repeats
MKQPSEIIINDKTLKEIIDAHSHWLGKDCDGWEDMRADLRSANLSSANLSYADLRSADLRYANLSSANLSSANLSYADLRYANLSSANLSSANLSYADLRSANLSYAQNLYFPYSCPDFGIFIGWKKASGYIVQLEIPEDAKRCSATGRKCRCNKAKVLGIYDYKHNLTDVQEVSSDRDKNFIYKVREIVSVDDFDEDRWNECSTGIHFFINFQEAVNYCC